MRLRYLLIVLICIGMANTAIAQRRIMNMPEHDNKAYYFGLTFGLNYATYKIKNSQSFTENDTFKSITPGFSPGFSLGLMGNLRMNQRFDLRFVPSLIFSEKKLTMLITTPGEDSSSTRSIESIYMHLPLQVKFKSDRINNFRFYAMTGVKLDIDLAANSRSRRTDEWLKVKPIDMGYEIGVGFEFYNPNFIFAPEIKLSQGLMNQQYKDARIPLSNALEQLSTRMIVISIHLEG